MNILGLVDVNTYSSIHFPVWLWFIGFAVISVSGYILNKKRLSALAAYAKENNFTYSLTTDSSWLTLIDTRPFNYPSGHAKKAKESLAFEVNGKPGVVFDYQYVTGSGRNRSVYYFKVAFIYTGINGSPISLTVNGSIREIVQSRKEIKFEDQAFNKKYAVECADPKFAYDTLTPETLKILMESNLKEANLSSLVWDNDYLMYSDKGKWKPEDVTNILEIMKAVVKETPKFLIADSQPLAEGESLPGSKEDLNVVTEYDRHQAQVRAHEMEIAEEQKLITDPKASRPNDSGSIHA